MFRCSAVPWCSGVPVFRCSGVPVFRCSGVPVFRCSGVPVFRCSGVPVFRCSGVLGCSGVPVFLVLVHASTDGRFGVKDGVQPSVKFLVFLSHLN